MNRTSVTMVAFGLALSAGCAGDEPSTGQGDEALIAEQCSYFAANDRVTICHHTSSARNPYVIVRTNIAACAGHSGHNGDYIAVDDPTCNGGGCFPAGAPYDGSVECCEGLAPVDGYCTAVSACPCTGMTLPAIGGLPEVTWDSSFTTGTCIPRDGAEPAIALINTTRAQAILNEPACGIPVPGLGCGLCDAFGQGNFITINEAESAACLESLREIALQDGVSCSP